MWQQCAIFQLLALWMWWHESGSVYMGQAPTDGHLYPIVVRFTNTSRHCELSSLARVVAETAGAYVLLNGILIVGLGRSGGLLWTTV